MGRRGSQTEKFLNKLHQRYKRAGKALIRKTAAEVYYRFDKKTKRRVASAKRGAVDYVGTLNGRFVCFDAKQTKNKYRLSLHRDHVPEHQKNFLSEHAEYGGIAFLYVHRTAKGREGYFLYPVPPGEELLLTAKSIPFDQMIELPSSGDWLDWIEDYQWIWTN